MNITCPHCQAKLNVPDEKIPKDRDASFKCPKCRESVPIKAAKPGNEAVKPGAGAAANPSAGPSFSPAGRNQALICMPPSPARQQMAAAVQQAGYTPETPDSTADALDLLEYRVFPLVVMDDDFDNDNEMAGFMTEMDMSLRRKICLVRVSPGVSTGDPMTALHSSANCVVNRSHLEQDGELARDILTVALQEHDNFYTVFNESLKATGKA